MNMKIVDLLEFGLVVAINTCLANLSTKPFITCCLTTLLMIVIIIKK
jgi:hypothetical protein